MTSRSRRLLQIARRSDLFSQVLCGIHLRPYQSEAFHAVVDSVSNHRGLSFVIIFSRQSGKDELIANLIIYLLCRLRDQPASIVCAQPTFKPQTINAMDRLEARLSRPWFKKQYRRTGGYIYKLGQARCTYFSAEPTANVVGATARTLLIINEAQDVSPAIYDKNFAPMAASGNATKIFSGTSWTSNTLLARELRAAAAAQQADGLRRVFVTDGEAVGKCNAHYAAHMAAQIARFGRQHPLIKTQYFCEEIDAQAGMFPPARQILMHGSHSAQTEPTPGKIYAFLIDVAGQDENAGAGLSRPDASPELSNPSRDSTFLKIVEIDLSNLDFIGKSTYKVVYRQVWTGAKHVTVFGALKALAAVWQPLRIVIDATGVGEGLWSLLDNAYGEKKVVPVKFSNQVKSYLGYGFLAIVESGRFQEYSPFDSILQEQLDHCQSEIQPGPAKLMSWGVPDGCTGGPGCPPIHDDDLIASALCAELDRQEWHIPTTPMWSGGHLPIQPTFGELNKREKINP